MEEHADEHLASATTGREVVSGGRRHRPVLVAGLAAGAVVLAGTAAVASAQRPKASEPTPVTAVETDPSGPPHEYDRPVPDGKLPVVDGRGDVAGFIDAGAYERGDRFPLVDAAGDREVHGLAVTDARGTLVGYFVEQLGFVDLTTIRDAASLDAAYAAWAEETALSQAELERLIREAEMGRDDVEPAPPG